MLDEVGHAGRSVARAGIRPPSGRLMGRLTREQRRALDDGRDDPRWRPRKPRRRTVAELEADARAAITANAGDAMEAARVALVAVSLDASTTAANRAGAANALVRVEGALAARERAKAMTEDVE